MTVNLFKASRWQFNYCLGNQGAVKERNQGPCVWRQVGPLWNCLMNRTLGQATPREAPIWFANLVTRGGFLLYRSPFWDYWWVVLTGPSLWEQSVHKAPNDIECGVIEINLKRQKWFLIAIHQLHAHWGFQALPILSDPAGWSSGTRCICILKLDDLLHHTLCMIFPCLGI